MYMGEEDMARQAPNVFRMRLLGTQGSARLLRNENAEGCHQ